MFRKRFIFLLILTVCLIAFLFFIPRSCNVEKENTEVISSAKKLASEPVDLGVFKPDTVIDKHTAAKSINIKESVKIPPECSDYWEQLTANSLNDVIELIKKGKLVPGRECLNTEKNYNKIKSFEKYRECMSSEKSIEVNSLCLFHILTHRAVIIDILSGEKEASEYPANILMNKITARFAGIDNIEDLDYRYIDSLINELQEQRPDLYASYKTKLALTFISNAVKGPLNYDLAEFLEQCKEFENKDPELLGIELYLSYKDNWDSKKEDYINFLNEYISDNPDNPFAYYYKALYYWREGDRDNTVKLIDKSVKLANKRHINREIFIQTLKKAQTEPYGTKIFAFSITFNIDDD